MYGIDGIHVLGATGVARHAARVDLLGRVILKDKNLGDVAATGDVRRSRSVAALAALV